jgi:hypothetical protein
VLKVTGFGAGSKIFFIVPSGFNSQTNPAIRELK